MRVPKRVKEILDQLHKSNHEAYIVGGCVRDMILGIEPHDYDITTSAEPMEVKAIFDRTIDTGIEHGTVTVMMGEESFEVTTYRLDGDYTDHRRPDRVDFTKSLTEDLKRRDFTINAMAYNPEEGVVDLFEGQKDLEAGIVRCVGVAKERFREDALRMLRAVRFAARFGFDIEDKTAEAIGKLASLISNVSAERIHMELTKTLCSDHPEYMELLVTYGLIDDIIPEYRAIIGLKQNNPYHQYTVDQHTYNTLKHVPPEEALRWTMYLHDIGKGTTKSTDEEGTDHFYGHQEVSERIANDVLGRLKFDNKTRKKVLLLIRNHDYRFPATLKSVRKAMAKVGADYFEDYLTVQQADILGQATDKIEARLADLTVKRKMMKQVTEEGQCVSIRDMAISGGDIMALGLPSGAIIGEVLKHLLEMVIESPDLNTREALLQASKAYLSARGYDEVD